MDIYTCPSCAGFHSHIREEHAGSVRSHLITYRWTCAGCGVRFENVWRLGTGWSGPTIIGQED